MEIKSAIEMLPQLILRLIVFLLIIGLIIYGIKKVIQFLRENSFHGKIKMIIISIISILIMAASWVLNMGWLRFFMTFLLIPVMHSIVFFFMNLYSAKCFEKSRKLKVLNIFFILTFLIPYLLMPDMDDYSVYAFFRLISNEKILNIAETVSFVRLFRQGQAPPYKCYLSFFAYCEGEMPK